MDSNRTASVPNLRWVRFPDGPDRTAELWSTEVELEEVDSAFDEVVERMGGIHLQRSLPEAIGQDEGQDRWYRQVIKGRGRSFEVWLRQEDADVVEVVLIERSQSQGDQPAAPRRHSAKRPTSR